ncbi:MAG: family 20 glycosylhydrolase [Clostridia bacterium]|nr:family 20 glycosylhydrolase [Clostridia bacterium]
MIFPVPVQIELKDDFYKLKASYPTDDLYKFYLAAKDAKEDFCYETDSSLGEEEHKIIVDANGIKIISSAEVGKFRALTSVFQMVAKSSDIKHCEIADKPQFKKRGYMLDISRSKMPTVKTIFGYIDYLAGLKYNEFQLYMESFVYKYDRYAKYTADFDCLDAEDIKAIEKYCEDRFIELVPNQNGFGHMGAWLAKDEFKHLALSDGTNKSGTLNPHDPKSLEFVDGFYESLLPNFKSGFVNVGLDEAMELGKYQSEEACKKYGRENVFLDYFIKLSDLIREKYGKRSMFWNDMIVENPDCFHRIPKDAIALEWDYEYIQSQKMADRCRDMHERGIEYYVCPSVNTHLSFTGRFDVTSFNVRTCGEVGRKHGALGYLLTDWSNTACPHFQYTAILPGALAAQYAWNVGVEQDGETFKTEYIYGAEDYCDEFVFGGAKLSRLLYRLANYYLLEPERVHVGTMCGETFFMPMKCEPTKFVNLDKCGDSFYFNNVDRYVREVMSQIEKVDCEPVLKREILLNAEMVLFANMLNDIRVRNEISQSEYDEWASLAEKIEKEFTVLWDMKNYSKGKENYISALKKRVEELKDYIK